MRRRDSVWLCCVCLTACLAAPARAGNQDLAEVPAPSRAEAEHLLETWIGSILDFDRIPGISIAIVHDQAVVYARGFGHADLEAAVEASPSTRYPMCSVTKLFTAIAVMQLRDAGKLELDDPVSAYLQWFAPEPPGPAEQPPTLRDLLRHSSGLPCEPDHVVWSDPAALDPPREELIDRVSRLEMSYPPNTKFNYSNLGFALLGEVVSAVSGMRYEEYLNRHVLGPLGLEHTALLGRQGQETSPLATGYGRWPREGARVEVEAGSCRALAPAWGLVSSVEDLAKLATWQLRVLDGKDDTVLAEDTLREMYTTQWPDPEWGLGFTIWRMGDTTFVGHQGGCAGYKSQVILCPEQGIAVVVMTNATDAPQFTLALRAYEIMAPALSSRTAKDGPESRWARFTGYYTAARSWSEAEVLQWRGSLAVLWVPSANPNPVGSLVMLRQVDEHLFREVTADGSLGKHYAFGTDETGTVVAMRFNNNVLRRSAPASTEPLDTSR